MRMKFPRLYILLCFFSSDCSCNWMYTKDEFVSFASRFRGLQYGTYSLRVSLTCHFSMKLLLLYANHKKGFVRLGCFFSLIEPCADVAFTIRAKPVNRMENSFLYSHFPCRYIVIDFHSETCFTKFTKTMINYKQCLK